MSFTERLRQRRGRDLRTIKEFIPESSPDGDAPAGSSIAVETVDRPTSGPLADMLRRQLEEAPLAGLAELRAAAAMVAEGLAERVILSGFESWPGLVSEMERLAERHGLSISPQLARCNGRVDLVVAREDFSAD